MKNRSVTKNGLSKIHVFSIDNFINMWYVKRVHRRMIVATIRPDKMPG